MIQTNISRFNDKSSARVMAIDEKEPTPRREVAYGWVKDSLGLVVGNASMETHPEENYGYVFSVEVKEEYRKQGLATQILRTAEVVGRALGLDCLMLNVHTWNEPAIRLYKSLGYTETEQLPRHTENDTVAMKRVLRDG